ncbi:uncharacterized protein [Nicotiana tomentosiformis]|uniref:uncharacterized protein n=1 Tax=Nicotiana tomentosiformis TaxID=4098 RepID=UPI00051B1367|nr:uncharacterized protein LOC104085288 isoform X2 [Nicotiana tomentosiformis]XP_033509078.1 uncharacterized protein LOC104085288 isoform X2 [Nicotiana tomentosiformis]
MIEAPEELSRLTLSDKVVYILEEAETQAEHPTNAPSLSGNKQSMGIDDKKDILKQLKKLRKDVDKFRPWIVQEREKESMYVHSPYQDANVAIQGDHFNLEKEIMHLQSPIQDANVSQQGEDCNEAFSGEPVDFINVDDSDNDSKSGKRTITLDVIELPENFSQIVKFGEVNEYETTLVHQGRTRVPGKHVRSPFLPYFSSDGSTSIGPPLIFNIKHPFTGVMGEDVDPALLEEFNKWLYLGTCTISKRKKAPYTVKDNQLNPWLDLGVEKVDKND